MLQNIDKPTQHVLHASLEAATKESQFRRKCPCCDDGVLLIHRGDDLKLQAEDHCISCGQRFVYDDIEQIRKRDIMR